MLRLWRTMFVLLAINIVCIVVVIAAHGADAAWGCLSFYRGTSDRPDRQLFDLTSGKFVVNQPYPVYAGNVSGTYDTNRLIYNYRSPNQIHRIGVVNHDAHHYLDFPETDGIFTIQQPPSPALDMFPITTFDSVHQSQTVTLYMTDTLTPIVSVTQAPVLLPPTRYDASLFTVSWSPNGKSFWFPVVAETQLSAMVVLQTGLTVTLPLQGAGYPLNLRYMWSKTGRAVAISSFNGGISYVNIFVAENDDWANAQRFYLNGSSDSLNFIRWSSDEQTLYLHKLGDVRTSNGKIQSLAFSVKSQRLVEVDERQSDGGRLHLNDQWLCDQTSYNEPAQLISVSGEHPPIPLVNFAENQGGCTLSDDPTGTNLIIAMPSTTPDGIQWAVLAADPFAIKPITLPSQTRFVLMWLDGGAKAVFFTRDIATDVGSQEYVGHLGLLDLASSRWQLLPYPIAINSILNYSPDRTRFTVSSADEQQTYFFSSDGQLLATLPFATDNYLGTLWAPDSSRIALVRYFTNGDLTFIVLTYDRDGHQLADLHTKSDYLMAPYKSFASCDPLPKFPRLNLPQ